MPFLLVAGEGMSALAASKDKMHDRQVNKIGRQQAKSSLYKNSREGCNLFRVKGINDKY